MLGAQVMVVGPLVHWLDRNLSVFEFILEPEIPHAASEAESVYLLLLEWDECAQALLVLKNYFIQRVDTGNLEKSVSSGESKLLFLLQKQDSLLIISSSVGY